MNKIIKLYESRISWSLNSDWFLMSWINRDTTAVNLYACGVENGKFACETLERTTSNLGWIEFKGTENRVAYKLGLFKAQKSIFEPVAITPQFFPAKCRILSASGISKTK